MVVPASPAPGVEVFASGFYRVVSTDAGLRVRFDGDHQVEVTLPRMYLAQVCGLCGNFNGDPADDFRNPQGGLEPDSASLGASWEVTNSTRWVSSGRALPTAPRPSPRSAWHSSLPAALQGRILPARRRRRSRPGAATSAASSRIRRDPSGTATAPSARPGTLPAASTTSARCTWSKAPSAGACRPTRTPAGPWGSAWRPGGTPPSAVSPEAPLCSGQRPPPPLLVPASARSTGSCAPSGLPAESSTTGGGLLQKGQPQGTGSGGA